MNIEKMEPTVGAIITDPNFDYSKLTWEEHGIPILTFLILRFASPEDACWAAYKLIEKNSPELFARMCRAVNMNMVDAAGVESADSAMLKPMFLNRRRQDVLPIVDFDFDLARKSHGNWPVFNWPISVQKLVS